MAPTPVAAISTPYVCGPPCRISRAMTGISTEYGMPMMLVSASRSSTARTGRNPDT